MYVSMIMTITAMHYLSRVIFMPWAIAGNDTKYRWIGDYRINYVFLSITMIKTLDQIVESIWLDKITANQKGTAQ